jgi:Tol biopolymer transport system component
MPLTLNILSVQHPKADGFITRISTAANGAQVNGHSYDAEVSTDGHYVVFTNDATDLGAGAVKGNGDLFRKNLLTGTVELISAGYDGAAANNVSYDFHASADAARVVFESEASNLVNDGDNGVFSDIFVKDFATSSLLCITAGANGDSDKATLSANGRFVAFESRASNLVANDTDDLDLFVKDLNTQTLARFDTVERAFDYQISDDGRYLTFASEANNLVANDTNDAFDIFRKDLRSGAIERLSLNSLGQGTVGGGTIAAQFSADGRYMVFESTATNLVAGDTNGQRDVFRKNLATGEVVRVSMGVNGEANNRSFDAQVSADGRYVTFTSYAGNLVTGDTNGQRDVFRKDMLTGAIERLSATPATPQGSQEGNDDSTSSAITGNGRFVVMRSLADNLMEGDTNGCEDLFLVDAEHLPHALAIGDGRFIELKLGVGPGAQVDIAWGDGTSATTAAEAGVATLGHAYEVRGVKAAVVSVHEGDVTWAVAHTIDVASGTMSRNTNLADTLAGGAAADVLKGDGFTNLILGNDGADTLYGGLGKDMLSGGRGRDIFVFDSKLNKKTNLDKVTDFFVKDDTIWLDNKYMAKLGRNGSEKKPHKLDKAFFALDKAKDANDYVIYKKSTGALYYDSDGSGGKAAIQIATLSKKLKMTYADFFVV